MASRTQIVCLHEGERGRSIDPIFIRTLLKALAPAWIRPWEGNNIIRSVACGGRSDLIAAVPGELRRCLAQGGKTTLMVWADLDHDMSRGEDLQSGFWATAKEAGITREEFEQAVFVFAKDRIENWVEYLLTGATNEAREGPRQPSGRKVADAARNLAEQCQSGATDPNMPASMVWSCRNWRALVERMRR